MAFTLNLGVQFASNCKSIKAFDTTGIVGINGNLTGYGSPNPLIANASAATLAIILPDLTIIPAINVHSILPNTNGSGFTILNTDLGLAVTENIPSGAWYFMYTVTISGVPYQFKGYKFLACAEKCCRDKAASKPLDCNCKKDKNVINQFASIWDEYESMISSANCGKINEANEKLIRVQALCTAANCNCS